RQATLRCCLTTRPLCCGAIPRQEPAVAQRPTGTLPPPRFKSAPQRRLLFRETSETAEVPREACHATSRRCILASGPVRVLTARSTWGRFRPARETPSARYVRLHDNRSNVHASDLRKVRRHRLDHRRTRQRLRRRALRLPLRGARRTAGG